METQLQRCNHATKVTTTRIFFFPTPLQGNKMQKKRPKETRYCTIPVSFRASASEVQVYTLKLQTQRRKKTDKHQQEQPSGVCIDPFFPALCHKAACTPLHTLGRIRVSSRDLNWSRARKRNQNRGNPRAVQKKLAEATSNQSPWHFYFCRLQKKLGLRPREKKKS